MELDTIHHSDLFDLCDTLDDASMDMILCDLPYGVTACEWDVRIPIEPMWEAFQRIIKPRGAIVLTATEPFASMLRMSWLKGYKYDWVWDKKTATGGALAVHRPMRAHEMILIFGSSYGDYFPQMETLTKYEIDKMRKHDFLCNAPSVGGASNISKGYTHGKRKHPRSVIRINGITPVSQEKQNSRHPTQKPVALFEYLIKTYTQPGELVFDPCVGSGTTAIAARNTGRHYIVGDMMEEYVDIARTRIQNTDPYQATVIDDKHTQLSLFEDAQ